MDKPEPCLRCPRDPCTHEEETYCRLVKRQPEKRREEPEEEETPDE